jgi:ComF family protein
MLKSLLDFVFPTDCAVCQKPPSPICNECIPQFQVSKSAFEGKPVWYATEYSEPMSKILAAYKDESRTTLAHFLAAGLNVAITEAISVLGPCWICVPPRNRRNYKKRGFDPVLKLLAGLDLVAAQKLPPGTLSFQRKVLDQRKLDRSQRESNVLGSMIAIPGTQKVLLIDDVMTTGSTIKECARALSVAGYEVVGICVLAKRIM